jgi:hypothetical protein
MLCLLYVLNLGLLNVAFGGLNYVGRLKNVDIGKLWKKRLLLGEFANKA